MPAFSRAGEGGISRKNKSSIVSLPIILKKKVNFAKIKKEGKEELAKYWKKHYNTEEGAGSVEHFLELTEGKL